ncbi:hypothetical protein AZE42_11309 [Rhizopogon vesiculosus]|uniref:Uncharacterized protein n=1 Tax=Rhizopogon vesiculosus TaxID=180088 RepID=A0A1J8Q020_9AGAM|nr:hypothetical protein AZE42_11309 [Rhizopogon vesiculosus]
MPQQSRGRGFWDHAPSGLQLCYVAEQQSQVNLIYILLTACVRTTGRTTLGFALRHHRHLSNFQALTNAGLALNSI